MIDVELAETLYIGTGLRAFNWKDLVPIRLSCTILEFESVGDEVVPRHLACDFNNSVICVSAYYRWRPLRAINSMNSTEDIGEPWGSEPPRDHQGALWPMPLNGGKRFEKKQLYSTVHGRHG